MRLSVSLIFWEGFGLIGGTAAIIIGIYLLAAYATVHWMGRLPHRKCPDCVCATCGGAQRIRISQDDT